MKLFIYIFTLLIHNFIQIHINIDNTDTHNAYTDDIVYINSNIIQKHILIVQVI